MEEAYPPHAQQDTKQPSSNPATINPTHVVGIGASAGGLEALQAFFRHMPLDTGMAFVVVQHLSPDFKSLMDEILQRETHLAIKRVEDNMSLTPDTIYLIPPRVDMVLREDRLRLTSATNSSRGVHLPIDTFFVSLAQAYGHRAVGIVLSGTGSDGSQGIRAIKEAEGLVLVQDLETAQFDGMPRSALLTGVADTVCAPAEMPEILGRLLLDHVTTVPPELDMTTSASLQDRVRDILLILQQHYGIDFSWYKRATVHRRLQRRMNLVSAPDLDAYIHLLQQSPREVQQLHADLLIGVTRFFRDPEAFTALAEEVFPALLEQKSQSETLRVWVAGCATGEEAYSLAMLLHEIKLARGASFEVKVFATDIARHAVDYAATGRYPKPITADVSPERLELFFADEGDTYQVTRMLRQSVVFAPHNLLTDAPFGRMDLVVCRNLLIYLEPEAQDLVISRLHYALQANGFLMLGPSESMGRLEAACSPVNVHWKIFRKTQETPLPSTGRLPLGIQTAVDPSSFDISMTTAPTTRLNTLSWSTYARIVEDYCPTVLGLDATGTLLWMLGDASAYLHSDSGAFSNDITHAIHPDLRALVISALHLVSTNHGEQAYHNVAVQLDDKVQWVTLRVKWLADAYQGQAIVVLYIETAKTTELPLNDDIPLDMESAAAQRIVGLEQALQSSQEHLQAALEEAQSSNEELQATNEEVIAANEELQSTNEELQSVNQELHTVNAEHQAKIAELEEVTTDLENILKSSAVGMMFLDEQLNIRRFNPSVSCALNVLSHDIGRPFHHITTTFPAEGLIEALPQALTAEETLLREVHTDNGTWLLMQVLPYYTETRAVAGVVLTFTDISAQKMVEQAEREARDNAESILATTRQPLVVLDQDLRVISANQAFYSTFHTSAEATEQRLFFDLDHAQWDVPELRDLVERIVPERIVVQDFEMTHTIGQLGQRTILCNASRLIAPGNLTTYILLALDDITERKRNEESLRRYAAELERSNRDLDQFAYAASHDLKSPLRAIAHLSTWIVEEAHDLVPESVQENLTLLQQRVARMENLLDGLLNYSRIGRLDDEPTTVDTGSLVHDVLSLLHIPNTFTIETVEPLPTLYAPRVPLELVFRNLISNAVKHHDREDGHITVAGWEGDELVEFTVADDGSGIACEHHERIFEMFQTLKPQDQVEGSGVGLSMVKKTLEVHGGTIAVESAEGSGTTFRFTWPKRKLGQDSDVSTECDDHVIFR